MTTSSCWRPCAARRPGRAPTLSCSSTSSGPTSTRRSVAAGDRAVRRALARRSVALRGRQPPPLAAQGAAGGAVLRQLLPRTRPPRALARALALPGRPRQRGRPTRQRAAERPADRLRQPVHLEVRPAPGLLGPPDQRALPDPPARPVHVAVDPGPNATTERFAAGLVRSAAARMPAGVEVATARPADGAPPSLGQVLAQVEGARVVVCADSFGAHAAPLFRRNRAGRRQRRPRGLASARSDQLLLRRRRVGRPGRGRHEAGPAAGRGRVAAGALRPARVGRRGAARRRRRRAARAASRLAPTRPPCRLPTRTSSPRSARSSAASATGRPTSGPCSTTSTTRGAAARPSATVRPRPI